MSNKTVARSQVYEFLATVFRAEPSTTFIRNLQDPRHLAVFADLGLNLGEDFRIAPASEMLDELAIEFTRLFLGPGEHISAHESIFTEVDGDAGGLWGAKTVEVKKFIETTGLDYEPQFTGLPDHISVELEFMQRLAVWEAEKWSEDNRDKAIYCLKVQKKFLEEHLLRWVPKFCAEVIEKAALPFYQEMAKVTQDFVNFDHNIVNELLAEN